MTFKLSRIIPTKVADVVAVFDVDFNQVFPDSQPIKASIKENSTFFKHPLETSVVRTDHIIFNPIELSLSVILSGNEYRDTYQQIKQIYQSQTELIVQTKTTTYEKMFIQSIPHEETPDSFDAVVMNIQLIETLIAETLVTFQPARDIDSNTRNRGQQQTETPTDVNSDRGSTLFRLFG